MAYEWNVSYPQDHTLISKVPEWIRNLKISAKAQIDHEHETPVDGDATGGEHSNGSAVAYEGAGPHTNRPDGSTALADNAIDRGRIWLDDNFNPPMLKRWNGSAFEPVVGTHLGAYTDEDDDSETLAKAHAYLANQDGFVSVIMTAAGAGSQVSIYVGSTDDPAGAGDLVQKTQAFGVNYEYSLTFPVASGKYWEVTCDGTSEVIRWSPVGTLVKCTDQEA